MRGHPDLATPALVEFLGPACALQAPELLLHALHASLRLPESGASVDLLAQPEVLASLLRALDS